MNREQLKYRRREGRQTVILLTQAILAQKVREAAEAESPIDRAIRQAEARNAMLRAVAEEQDVVADEPVKRTAIARKADQGDRQYRNAFERSFRKAKSANVVRDHGHRQEYRGWWYDRT